MTYQVTTIRLEDNKLSFGQPADYADKIKAMKAAKKAAGRAAKFDGHYGPTSFAYVGRDVTAVVAW